MIEIILKIIQENLAINQPIKIETKISQLSLDSLSFIQVLISLEDTFQIQFKDEELNIKKYHIVKDIIDKVKWKIKK